MQLGSLALELFDCLIQAKAKARVLDLLQRSRKSVVAKLLPQFVQRLTVISDWFPSGWSPWVPPMDWLLLISIVSCPLPSKRKKEVGERTWPQ